MSEFLRHFSIVSDESAVEINKTQKGLKFLFVGWSSPFCYCSDLGGVHADSSVLHDYSEIFHSSLFEFAFFWFDTKLIFLKNTKYFFNQYPMFVDIL